ncbi:IQ domain-containing protein E isoform X3 [Castor canadensis]|uniref:IQ domain-containing protein E isoform X3 n=1 Tax=Castor canadensis TaxID=51338 RepID=A0AC58MQ20_CASCN
MSCTPVWGDMAPGRVSVGGGPAFPGQDGSGRSSAKGLRDGGVQGDDSLSAIAFDSDFETKAKRKGFHRPPPASPKSPYYSKPRKVASWRSLRTAGTMPLSSRVSLTPQKLWLGSAKQGGGTQPLHSTPTQEHAWTLPPSSTPDHLAEAVRVRRSDLRRSASNGHVPGIAVCREKEDMCDEIIELKKSLHMQKNNVDLMRTKLRRLEEENSRKDRQIEQLLDPGQGSEFVRTLAEKRPDTGWVITGLKQRIFRLEQQCKEKDSTISKLQTDMKTTNLEEMRVAMETYYEEIHRLQTLLASSDPPGKKPAAEKKPGMRKQKMNSALLNLSRSVQELTEENQSLKEDLARVLSNSPTVSKTKGYVDWSKPRLLRRIAELEKKVSSLESLKPHAAELHRLCPLVHSASSTAVHKPPKADRAENPEHLQHLRGTVKSLKGERSWLRAQLMERDMEVKQLLQTKADLEKELGSAREGERARQEQEQALTEEIETLTNKCQELEESKREERAPRSDVKREERGSAVDVAPEAPGEPRTPLPCSELPQPDLEPDSRSKDCPQAPGPCPDWRREAAARTLQARWKAHQQQKKAVLDEAAVVLQAAFRGHLARARLLSGKARGSSPPCPPGVPEQSSSPSCIPSPASQAKGNPEQEEVITIIQSVFRGFLARARYSATSTGTATAASPSTAAEVSRPAPSPAPLVASPDKDSKASGDEAVELEDKDEPRETAGPQLRSESQICDEFLSASASAGSSWPSPGRPRLVLPAHLAWHEARELHLQRGAGSYALCECGTSPGPDSLCQ